eukprot:Hpha_TRINITY_DN22983_c0_g1::TRINITY_DN22983_c0_g1_i1::g.153984::m.153984
MGCGSSSSKKKGVSQKYSSRQPGKKKKGGAGAAGCFAIHRAHVGAVSGVTPRYVGEERQFLSCGVDGWLRLTDADTGVRVWEYEAEGAPFTSCVSTLEDQGGMIVGGIVAAGGADGLWLLAGGCGTLYAQLKLDGGTGVHGVAFTRENMLLGAYNDGYVRVWDTAGMRCTSQMRAKDSQMEPVLCVRSFGNLCASAGADGVIRVWDHRAPSGAQLVRSMKGHRGEVYRVAARSEQDETHLASCGADGVVREWDVGTQRATQRLRGPWQCATTCCCYISNSEICVGTATRGAWLWKLGEGDDDDGDSGTVTALEAEQENTSGVTDIVPLLEGPGESHPEMLVGWDDGNVRLMKVGLQNSEQPLLTGPVERTESEELERELCQLCWENRRCVIFAPCLHMVCCSLCADRVDECPLCRERVTQRRNRLESTGSICTYVGERQPDRFVPSVAPEREQCVVCLAERRSIIFAPCLHLVCCDTCSTLVTECPLCRVTIATRRARMDSDVTIRTFQGRHSSAPSNRKPAPKRRAPPSAEDASEVQSGYTLQWSLQAQSSPSARKRKGDKHSPGKSPRKERSPRKGDLSPAKRPRSPPSPPPPHT